MKSPKRRPQPAKSRQPQQSQTRAFWQHWILNRPTSDDKRRELLQRALREMDGQALAACWWSVILQAEASACRRDLAELERLRIAGLRTIRDDHLVRIPECTPAERKRLRTMTPAQLRALAKRQAAKRRGKAVRS